MSHHPERTARNVRPVNQPPSFLNGGEFSADVDVLCVDGEGSRFPYSNFRVGISNEELFVEEDDDEYYENPLSCPSWVELKKQTQRVLAAQQKSK